MAIEYKNKINITKNSFIYAHLKENEAGFPESPGNAPVQQVLDLAEDQIIGTLSQVITFSKDVNNSLIYHMNIAGVSIATFEMPPDKFLKKVEFLDDTKTLTFTFITSEGETSLNVNLSSLIDTYTAGNGLALNQGVFSIKLNNNETRLVLNANGLSFDASDLIKKVEDEKTRATNVEAALETRIKACEDYNVSIDEKVQQAETAATNASNSAITASKKADLATEKANEASTSAQTAAQLLEQADLNLIESIEQTKTSTVSGGINEVTITQKNQNKSVFQTRNGDKGEKGNDGVCYFDFDYDETTGDLYIVYDELGKVPNFEFDETNGDLYIVYEGV